MSQSNANDGYPGSDTDRPDGDTGADSGPEEDEEPEIEEDLLQEELRIDGICGVY